VAVHILNTIHHFTVMTIGIPLMNSGKKERRPSVVNFPFLREGKRHAPTPDSERSKSLPGTSRTQVLESIPGRLHNRSPLGETSIEGGIASRSFRETRIT
jgi:hypothetical protein